MVSIDSTMWFQMANFLILMFVLNVVLFKPILRVLERREKHFQGLDEEVKSLDQSVEEKMANYEEKLRQARLEAMNEKNEIQQKASGEGKSKMDEARNEILQIFDDFKQKLDKEMSSARKILKTQAEKISVEISEKVLGRSIQ